MGVKGLMLKFDDGPGHEGRGRGMAGQGRKRGMGGPGAGARNRGRWTKDKGAGSSKAASKSAVNSSSPLSGYPLAMAGDDQSLLVRAIHGGRRCRRQLMDMGLHPGRQITVIRGKGRGPLLIQTGQTRLGLGRGMAEKIEVIPAPESRSNPDNNNNAERH